MLMGGRQTFFYEYPTEGTYNLLVAEVFIHVLEHHEGFLLRRVLVGDASKSHDR